MRASPPITPPGDDEFENSGCTTQSNNKQTGTGTVAEPYTQPTCYRGEPDNAGIPGLTGSAEIVVDTLNMGLRWDPGTHSRDDYRVDGTRWMSWIYPGQKSQRFINAPPGVLYWGDPGTPDASAFARMNQLAPRVGFALDPHGNGKWSIRGGIGSYFGQMQAGGFALGGAGTGAPRFRPAASRSPTRSASRIPG